MQEGTDIFPDAVVAVRNNVGLAFWLLSAQLMFGLLSNLRRPVILQPAAEATFPPHPLLPDIHVLISYPLHCQNVASLTGQLACIESCNVLKTTAMEMRLYHLFPKQLAVNYRK